MPNQPAKDSAAIYLRITQKVKDEIQSDIDRLNTDNPKGNVTFSSWIRDAINNELKRAKKKAGKTIDK